ncbi:Uncharacterized protein Adt_39038 [Abeliophyllum distichum]|uniref:NADH-ubiquinone oxidoreductase chain 4 n=1 Tax=Abeliophyllum distichum TaxID=126358 RepID=A0ABD1Q505_9LAMI
MNISLLVFQGYLLIALPFGLKSLSSLIRSYGKEYIAASLIREFLMIAMFCMLDPLIFYVLPESMSIPMLCGAEHPLFARIKLFFYSSLKRGEEEESSHSVFPSSVRRA